jgi:hypothetical protein
VKAVRFPHQSISADLPDGQISDFPVQPHLQKYSASRFTQIKSISLAVPALRGAYHDRHERWAWDAVDAAASGAHRQSQGGLNLVSDLRRADERRCFRFH